MKNVQKKIEEYLIDGKVRHLSKEKDINIKLGEIINYRQESMLFDGYFPSFFRFLFFF